VSINGASKTAALFKYNDPRDETVNKFFEEAPPEWNRALASGNAWE
jgi:hypothetical protein